MTSSAPAAVAQDRPPRSALVLLALVTGAIVANINLGVANVALPTIGRDLGATQDQLTAIANAFALGLASSVLYLGSIGDRYGRKLLFVLGCVLTVPTAMLAAWAPTPEVLTVARYLGGVAAALLFPTTLSLISALYRGRAKVSAIALWSGLGGGVAALGPLIGGWLLQYFWWGSVFLITLPLVVLALAVGLWVLPWRAFEERFPVDHLGGVLSVLGVGGLILTIERADLGIDSQWLVLLVTSAVILATFFWRQTRARRPLVSLPLAKARTFWVAFVAGAITFGSLIGAMFVGQQFTQNVLGYDTLEAAAVVLPAAVLHRGVRPGGRSSHPGPRVPVHLHARPRIGGGCLHRDARDVAGRRGAGMGAARIRPDRNRGGAGRHAGVALAHGLGADEPRRHGLGLPRPHP